MDQSLCAQFQQLQAADPLATQRLKLLLSTQSLSFWTSNVAQCTGFHLTKTMEAKSPTEKASPAEKAMEQGSTMSSARLSDFLQAIDYKTDAFESLKKLNKQLKHKGGKGALKNYQYTSTILPPDPKITGASPVRNMLPTDPLCTGLCSISITAQHSVAGS